MRLSAAAVSLLALLLAASSVIAQDTFVAGARPFARPCIRVGGAERMGRHSKCSAVPVPKTLACGSHQACKRVVEV